MSEKAFHKYCEAAVAVLNAQYQATTVIQHNGTVGAIREQLLKDFLTNHLPELVNVLSGQIFDAHDNFSKQQDVVLVMKGMPRLPFASGNDLIFQEGVVASIEIKTRLDATALTQIGSNIQSVRNLVEPPLGPTVQFGLMHSWPQNRLLTAIICYGGMSFESMGTALNNLAEDARPDLILDLTQGLLVKNHTFLVPKIGEFTYVAYGGAAQGFKMFLTFLTEITGTLSARGVAWRRYWG